MTKTDAAPKKRRRSTLALALTCGVVLSAAASNATARPERVPAITHRLHLRHSSQPGSAQQSTNWAGYVATGGGYKSVAATWTVPTVITSSDDRYSSTWVGIGGDPSPDLIQAGTEQDSVGGVARYFAWTETLPSPEQPIAGMVVRPGDSITVNIFQKLVNVWTIKLENNSTGASFTRRVAYPSSHLTAEWIHEAPTVGGTVATLARTTNAVFDNGFSNGKRIADSKALTTIEMYLVARIATPGPLDTDGDGFAVADGPNAPPAPSS